MLARADEDSEVLDVTGRPLGPAAAATRREFLDATVLLLSEAPMRDLRVVSIARAAGTSPGAFYQYFEDIEGIVLTLARHAREPISILLDEIDGDWSGIQGTERGRRLTGLIVDHWSFNGVVLRARNSAADEGHAALYSERMQSFVPLVEAFSEVLGRRDCRFSQKEEAAETLAVNATVGATALVSCLERTAMHQVFDSTVSGTREQAIDTMAFILHAALGAEHCTR